MNTGESVLCVHVLHTLMPSFRDPHKKLTSAQMHGCLVLVLAIPHALICFSLAISTVDSGTSKSSQTPDLTDLAPAESSPVFLQIVFYKGYVLTPPLVKCLGKVCFV